MAVDIKKSISVFKNGLVTGLLLQLAIGPVFFFIINLALQKTIFDGLIAVLAVTIVDYFYIALAILGVSALLKKKKIKTIFGAVSSIVLILFGIIIIKNIFAKDILANVNFNSINLFTSFTSTFLLTISSPMTIVFFTRLFASKAVEYHYAKRDLLIFGIATGLATLIFMGTSVILFSLIKESVPVIIIQILNLSVGCLLIGYGGMRLVKILNYKNKSL